MQLLLPGKQVRVNLDEAKDGMKGSLLEGTLYIYDATMSRHWLQCDALGFPARHRTSVEHACHNVCSTNVQYMRSIYSRER